MSQAAVLKRSHTYQLFKYFSKITLVRVADAFADVADAVAGFCQKQPGMLDADIIQMFAEMFAGILADVGT